MGKRSQWFSRTAYRLYEGRRGNRDTPPDMHAPERADMSQQ